MIQEKVVEISNPGLDFNNDTKGVKWKKCVFSQRILHMLTIHFLPPQTHQDMVIFL